MLIKTCCKMMKRNLATSGAEADEKFIFYSLRFDEYGIIIHDGTSSFLLIDYCPWCGKKLPESKRKQWFNELAKLGYINPLLSDEIPTKYQSDLWYRKNK